MELSRSKKWLFIATTTWLIVTLAVGAWWLYLMLQMGQLLRDHGIEHVYKDNLVTMLEWEGLFFFVLIGVISLSVYYLFYRDYRKSKGLQTFFASLSHELRTPLTNMRLQSELLLNHTKNLADDIKKSVERLHRGSYELENQFDNMLQLSRIEQGANFNLQNLNLYRYLESVIHKESLSTLKFTFEGNKVESDVIVDEFALKVILDNLIRNTIQHHREDATIDLKVFPKDTNYIQLRYHDNGENFTGEFYKLSSLFYRHRSHKGSGIGLYLVKKLIEGMQGKLVIELDSKGSLVFKLLFKRSLDE